MGQDGWGHPEGGREEPSASPRADDATAPFAPPGAPRPHPTQPAYGTPPPYAPPAHPSQRPYGSPPTYGGQAPYGPSPAYGIPPAYGSQPAGYPAPYQGYGYAPSRTSGFAIASFVLSLVWVFWLGSILAVIFGHVALTEIKRDPPVRGRGFAVAGLVIGYLALALFALALLGALATGSSGP